MSDTPFLASEAIAAKRDGHALSDADIARFVAGVADGSVSEAQVAALCMATLWRGMSERETVALTLAMRDSGETLRWDDLPGPVVDKHSTGGIGDNTSLLLAPIVAACGGFVPMISGRGLGHTGGTLDKLESIPGYTVAPDRARLRRTVREVGCAITGPSAALAPADGRIYAVRDVTATVESVPLIVASILSKKLAAGLQALVLDVKTGSGAFMARRDDAERLAQNLTAVAHGAGLPARALVTDMDEPLAPCAGNAIEIASALRFLADGGASQERLRTVVLALAGEMLALGGLCDDAADGRARARAALASGAASERFARMVAALGGPADLLEQSDRYLPRAPVVRPLTAWDAGFVAGWNTRALGLCVVRLGGGRTVAGAPIDPAVGLDAIRPVGSMVERGDPLLFVHARDEAEAQAAVAELRACVRIAPDAAFRPPLLA